MGSFRIVASRRSLIRRLDKQPSQVCVWGGGAHPAPSLQAGKAALVGVQASAASLLLGYSKAGGIDTQILEDDLAAQVASNLHPPSAAHSPTARIPQHTPPAGGVDTELLEEELAAQAASGRTAHDAAGLVSLLVKPRIEIVNKVCGVVGWGCEWVRGCELCGKLELA